MPYIKSNKDLPRVGRTKAVGETIANGGTKGVGGKNAPATPTEEHDYTADKPRSSDRIAAKRMQIANAESLSRQYLLSRIHVPSLKTVQTKVPTEAIVNDKISSKVMDNPPVTLGSMFSPLEESEPLSIPSLKKASAEGQPNGMISSTLFGGNPPEILDLRLSLLQRETFLETETNQANEFPSTFDMDIDPFEEEQQESYRNSNQKKENKTRGPNFEDIEDEMIVTAYLKVSEDSIKGCSPCE